MSSDKLTAARISIHALREEGDQLHAGAVHRPHDFYPRPPRGGRPRMMTAHRPSFPFLSTPSARRATWRSSSAIVFFEISIHALREEGDTT